MSEYVLMMNALWFLAGAIAVWYTDKRAYREGMVDAIVMHNRGTLTYEVYLDEDGEEMIEMKVEGKKR